MSKLWVEFILSSKRKICTMDLVSWTQFSLLQVMYLSVCWYVFTMKYEKQCKLLLLSSYYIYNILSQVCGSNGNISGLDYSLFCRKKSISLFLCILLTIQRRYPTQVLVHSVSLLYHIICNMNGKFSVDLLVS